MPRVGEAKESIVLLCRILKYSGIYQNLSPDDVRLAKFDKPDVIDKLSQVLQAILHIEHGIANAGDCKELDSVANVLKRLRYPRFNALCDESGRLVSSRELLLAIAWYLHIDKTIRRVQNEAFCAVDVIKLLLKDPKHVKKDSAFAYDGSETLTDKINRMTWVVAQLRLLKQEILSIEAGNTKKKILIGSQLKSEWADDPLLLLTLRNPSLGAEYEKRLEWKILLLQSCIQWRKVQDVFWLWMDSVLENAPRIDNAFCEPKAAMDGKISPLLSIFSSKLQVLGELLQRQRRKYPKSDAEAISSQLQPEQKLEVDKEMVSLRNRLLSLQHEPYLKPAGKGDQVSTTLFRHARPLQLEIDDLTRANNLIIKKMAELRSQAREKLQVINMRFSGSVFIPPEVPEQKSLQELEDLGLTQ